MASLLVVIAIAGTTSAAHAEKQDARKHYDKATAAFGLGNFTDAAAEYEAAFRLRPDPALLYNCAQSYRLAGNKTRAAELYRNYLRLYGDASNAEDARRHLKDLELELAAGQVAQPSPIAPSAPVSPAAVVDEAPPPALSLAPPPPTAPIVVDPPRAPSQDSDGARPVYRQPWFWVAVGAAVVGGTAAIILATKHDNDPTASFGSFPVN